MASFLGSLYMGLTIFGCGVLVIDLMGLLGHSDHDDGGHDDAGHAGDGHEGDFDHGAAHDANGDHDDADGHIQADASGVLILAILRHLRSAVYFSAGFGPMGLVATWRGYGTVGSLAWAVPTGCVSLVMVRTALRLLTKDSDSSLRPQDILMAKATVLIPVAKGKMGKVRILTGQSVSEQYALPQYDDESFKAGDVVYVTNVTDECVHIESEARFEHDAAKRLAGLS